MKQFSLRTVVVMAVILIATACFAAKPTYTSIPGVPQIVNDLGKMIAQEQANEVTPGGDEWAPGCSYANQVAFEKSGKLAKILAKVTDTKIFKDAIPAIQNLPTKTKTKVFTVYATPIYPTWAMNGRIDNTGTTDAGYAIEEQIANTLTSAVKSAVAIADFGHQIRAAQREVVTPGGTEAAPNFSDDDKAVFEQSNKLEKIVEKFKGTESFDSNIEAFKALPAKIQTANLEKLSVPVFPTWAMNGKRDDTGTTDAGYAVEQAIIAAMIKAIKAAL